MAPAPEVADIFRRHGEAFRQTQASHLGYVERRIIGAITACRTAVLGVEQCDDCGATRIAYNSCRNRHCPKCQGLARAKWLADRQAELLAVPYFHVVFTLPAPVGEIAFQNKAAVYAILFRTAAEALTTIAADPRHLGAKLGMTMVLHTWGQTLQHHPHIHCVIPGGGPSLDRTRWVACRPGFFLPVRVLSRLFRRLFLRELENVFDAGKLRFFGKLANLAEPQAFARRLGELRRLNWVVYAKPPFGGPEQVLAYLGRYTHRVAIANSRLLSLADGKVCFTWKDYRADGETKVMTLDADEFIRRFLLHALPDGFHRIRHYGFLANGSRGDNFALCRRLLRLSLIARERDFSVGIDLPEETGTTYWTPVAITSDMDGVQGRETLTTQCPSRSLPTSLTVRISKRRPIRLRTGRQEAGKKEFIWAPSHMMPRQPQLPHKTRWEPMASSGEHPPKRAIRLLRGQSFKIDRFLQILGDHPHIAAVARPNRLITLSRYSVRASIMLRTYKKEHAQLPKAKAPPAT